MRFDAKAFLTAEFVNAQGVRALMGFYGLGDVNISTIEKWFQRGNIPGAHLPLLLCIRELEKGDPVRLAQYLREADDHGNGTV